MKVILLLSVIVFASWAWAEDRTRCSYRSGDFVVHSDGERYRQSVARYEDTICEDY